MYYCRRLVCQRSLVVLWSTWSTRSPAVCFFCSTCSLASLAFLHCWSVRVLAPPRVRPAPIRSVFPNRPRTPPTPTSRHLRTNLFNSAPIFPNDSFRSWFIQLSFSVTWDLYWMLLYRPTAWSFWHASERCNGIIFFSNQRPERIVKLQRSTNAVFTILHVRALVNIY